MQHFFSILTPEEHREDETQNQKPFFGPAWRLTRGERDAAILDGKLPPGPDAHEPDLSEPMTPRFVALLSPPFL